MATRITVTIETIGAGGDVDRVQLMREVVATGDELPTHVDATSNAAFMAFATGRPAAAPF